MDLDEEPAPQNAAQYAAWRAHETPAVERIADRLWSIPTPCPFPIRYTSCYLIGGDDGRFVLVDPGWESDRNADLLRAGVELAGYRMDGLVGVILTHSHADHGAIVRRLPESAWLGTGQGERGDPVEGLDRAEFEARDRAWLEHCGVPDDQLAGLAWDWPTMRRWGPGREPDRFLDADSVIDLPGAELRIVPTPGHTVGHICIVDERARAVLTGDHVLPHITPSVGIDRLDGEARDAEGEYLASLERLHPWNEHLVCPAHEYRFEGLSARLDVIEAHHLEREAETERVLDRLGDATPWQIAENLSWSRGWDGLNGENRRLALAESNAMLRHAGARQHPGSPTSA